MAKAKKKKTKLQSERDGGLRRSRDPMLYDIRAAFEDGDNRSAVALSRAALEDVEATPEAKEVGLMIKQRLSYDPVALAFAGGGALGWIAVLFVFVLGRG